MTDSTITLQAVVDNLCNQPGLSASEREESYGEIQAMVERLRKDDINTVGDLLRAIGSSGIETGTRIAALSILHSLSFRESLLHIKPTHFDKRMLFRPLMAAYQSDDPGVRSEAIYAMGSLKLKRAFSTLYRDAFETQSSNNQAEIVRALGYLGDPRALEALVKLARDKTQHEGTRYDAVRAICGLEDRRIFQPLLELILDPNEDMGVRSVALENLEWQADAEILPVYFDLLVSEWVELRFWAAYGLVTMASRMDMSGGLPQMEQATLDNSIHRAGYWYWWSVSREVMPVYELTEYRKRTGRIVYYIHQFETFLISPALEYWDFSIATQKANESNVTPSVTLNKDVTLQVSPSWLADQLKRRWPKARLNTRQARCYLLNWEIDTRYGLLIGGLHVDGYGVFVTGKLNSTLDFAIWYRGVIPPEHTLQLYDWADPGFEIKPSMTKEKLQVAFDAFQRVGYSPQ